jgi:DNA-binding MarR family transcriptional regulator
MNQMGNTAKTDARRGKIDAIFEQMLVFSQYFDNTENIVQAKIDRNISASLRTELRGGYPNLTECHALQGIHETGPMNGTQLSKKLGMTRGGVSKLVGKLIKKKLIQSESLPDNRKEIYYSLTKTGKVIADIHQSLHEEARKQFVAAFEEYSSAELDLIEKIFTKMLAMFNRHWDVK